ncbi:MAG: TetR/AcrR family transcriptional regulator [Bacteroidetes bacterium]|nr:MAG: TetR/AcrR family transcriptional regulator [Bacteroidota bacterium]TAG89131.1 MAG: TetR/AcrR family transcriptional regulator [Bacteroidota bacterium]
MPTLTFEKLKTEKKEKFIQSALEEFAQNSYQNASITQLAKTMKIAKGSIYQYFESKKDLYFFLLNEVNQKKQHFIAQYLKEIPDDFFELLKKIYILGINFDKENEIIQKFLLNAQYEKNNTEIGNLYQQSWLQSVQYYKNLLLKQQANHKIRNDISIDLMAHFIVQSGRALPEILQIFPNYSPEKYIEEWLYVLKSGLQPF